MPPSIGILGGTFDPPHWGHLALAECARERLGLATVLFVPAGTPPHKRSPRVSSARDRLAMTRLAVHGNAAFRVSTLEVRREGPSFTIDTLRAIRAAHPRHPLVLLMGEDMWATFATWRDPLAILRLARVAVAARPGVRAPRRARARVSWLDNLLLDVSSSAIRERARRGRSLRYLLPDRVAAYVRHHRLYARAT